MKVTQPQIIWIQGVNYDVSKRNWFSPTEHHVAAFYRGEKMKKYSRDLFLHFNARN